MWLMLETGFVSIVEKPEDRDAETLTVRAREVAHLIEFVGLAGQPALEGSIIETEGTDYPYRAVLSRKVVADAVAEAVERIDYSNFKTRAKKVGGERYESFLMRVWVAGLSLTGWRDAERLNALYRAEDWTR